jgi:outer membrane receptor protein involved in Fe transport
MIQRTLAGAIAACVSASAWSQAAAPTTEAPKKDEQGQEAIQRVEITATKRLTYVRDIAGSVSAVTGRDLERSGAQNLSDFVKMIPGVQLIEGAPDQQRLSIRGGTSNSQFINPTTGTFIDDTPFDDPYAPRVYPDVNPFDIATVEILKGPQGTLFGGSALNGAVRYVPVKPKFGQTEFKYFAQYNSISQGGSGVTVGGAANLPLGETAAIRFVALDRKIPGYVDNTVAGVADTNHGKQQSYRLLARWQPVDRLSVDALYWKQTTKMKGWPVVDNPDGRLVDGTQPTPGYNNTAFELGSLNVGYAFDGFDLLVSASRTSKPNDGWTDASAFAALFGPSFTGARLAQSVDTTVKGSVYELRLTSNTQGPVSWVAGLYRQQTKASDRSPFFFYQAFGPFPAGFALQTSQADIKTEESAVFGEASWRPMKGLELILGGRWHKNVVEGDNAVTAGGATTVSSQNVPESKFDPKLAVRFQATPDVQVWSQFNTGYRFGGINSPTGGAAPPTWRSDRIKNFEVGVRADALAKRLQADLTLYRIDWKNPQSVIFNGVTSYVDNFGRVRGDGVEVALQFAPEQVRGLKLGLSAAYNDMRTTEDVPLSAGVTAPAGSQWIAASRLQTAVSLAYEAGFGSWIGGIDLRHARQGDAPSDLTPGSTRIFGYSTTDLMFTLRPAGKSAWPTLAVGATNLSDERAFVNVVSVGGGAIKRYYYNQPRTFMVRVSGEF